MSAPDASQESLQLAVRESPMTVRLFTPAGTPPRGGVLFYMDAFGLRGELDRMCRRYAEHGYATFLPDLYHRLGGRTFPVPPSADAPLDPGMHAANDATSIAGTLADTAAILEFASADPRFAALRFGAVGHCMGARHALAAAAQFGVRVRAASCLHGGRMVWDGPTSPHLLIPKVTGALYFAFAANDVTCPSEHQAVIERTVARSGVKARVDHFDAHHGWTFPERWCFDQPAAERAWRRTMDLFEEAVG